MVSGQSTAECRSHRKRRSETHRAAEVYGELPVLLSTFSCLCFMAHSSSTSNMNAHDTYDYSH